MSNQYWKNKIQLKEAYTRGREKALQEAENSATRLFRAVADQLDKTGIVRKTIRKNVADAIDGVISIVTKNKDKTFKLAPTLTGKTGARYVTIPGAVYDEIEDLLGGGADAARFIRRLNEYLIELLQRRTTGVSDLQDISPGLQGRTLAGMLLRFIREEFPRYIDDFDTIGPQMTPRAPSNIAKSLGRKYGDGTVGNRGGARGLTVEGAALYQQLYKLLLKELPPGIV